MLKFMSLIINKTIEVKRSKKNINAEQVCTQFCVYLYLYQCKCNHVYAINHVYN